MKSNKELDLELVKAAQDGDVRAFETLVRRYKVRLLRHLSNILHNAADAEDVVQDTCIRAYTGLHTFRGDSAFSTWFFRIGINTAKRSLVRLRQRLARMEPLMDTEGSQQYALGAIDFETPDERLQTREILGILDAALDELPEEQRTALLLREIEGMSYEEIAEQMHSPVGTVRSRIHRARDTVAHALGKY